MTCCIPTIITFHNKTFNAFGYSDDMRARHGNTPMIQVLYRDEETGEFVVSTMQSRIELTGNPVTHVRVEHGGPNSGVIKIL